MMGNELIVLVQMYINLQKDKPIEWRFPEKEIVCEAKC